MEACQSVHDWAVSPFEFKQFSTLATLSKAAADSDLHVDGLHLTALIPTHNGVAMTSILDKMMTTCIALRLFGTTPSGASIPFQSG